MNVVLFRGGTGWQPIDYMAGLAAHLLGARITAVDSRSPKRGVWDRIRSLQPRKRGAEPCLLILPAPAALYLPQLLVDWQGRYGHVAAWVIDSFWEEWIPRLATYSRSFDHFFVTNPEDLTPWRRKTPTPVSVLPWGTDALDLGCGSGDRETDLLRVGRQPSQWEDDAANAAAAAQCGIRYVGRPPLIEDAKANQEGLMRAFGKSRYTLCFSNTIDRLGYTHKRREYVTARWMDALASGAVVAGIAPRCEVVRQLFWPEALLELGTTDRRAGLKTVHSMLQEWTPTIPWRNHHYALARLDWRWRFKTIAQHFGLAAPKLHAELGEISRKLERSGQSNALRCLEADSGRSNGSS
jgi:hypothetical protein